MTIVATPQAMTSAMARTCAHIRRMSRRSLRSRTGMALPAYFGGPCPLVVDGDIGNATVLEGEYAMRDLPDAGIMGDDGHRRLHLLIDPRQRFEDQNACVRIKGA